MLTCSFDGCTRPVRALSLCAGHYQQKTRGKELRPLAARQENKGRLCDGPECARHAYSNGLCASHASQQKRGQPLTPIGHVRPGPKRPERTTCSGPECDRESVANGLCHAHCQQIRRGKPLTPIGQRTKIAQTCNEEGCDKPRAKKGWCGTHYAQHWRYGVTKSIRIAAGRRLDSNGYVYVRRPDSPESRRGWGAEHRVVMAEILGRKLSAEESVHHKNGDRTDNRPENLELWSRWQPTGQRVSDKIQYAKDLLSKYEPEALAGMQSRP